MCCSSLGVGQGVLLTDRTSPPRRHISKLSRAPRAQELGGVSHHAIQITAKDPTVAGCSAIATSILGSGIIGNHCGFSWMFSRCLPDQLVLGQSGGAWAMVKLSNIRAHSVQALATGTSSHLVVY